MTALCERPDAGLGLRLQQLRQRQAAHGQAAELEEVAAGHSVAVTRICLPAIVSINATPPVPSRFTSIMAARRSFVHIIP